MPGQWNDPSLPRSQVPHFLLDTALDAILQHAPVGILVLDEMGRIIRYNQKSSHILQCKEDLRGRYLNEFCFTDEDRVSLQEFQHSNFEYPLLITLRSGLGNEVQLRITASRMDPLLTLYLEDNAEILTLEQELRNFKTAINSAADAIVLFDENGLIFYTNPAFEEQVGLTKEEILGLEIQCFWSDDNLDKQNEFWMSIQNAWPWSGEMIWKQADHSPYDVEVRMTPIFSDKNRVVGFICVLRDITERKRIQDQIKRYSENLEQLVSERTQTLANLHDITKLLHSTHSLDERLRLLLISATADEMFRFNRAFLLLTDPSHENLVGRIAFGPSSPSEAGLVWNRIKEFPQRESFADTLQTYLEYAGEGEQKANQIVVSLGTPLDNESSLLVQSIRQKRPFVVKEGMTDTSFDPAIIQQLENDHFAVVPMLVQEEPVGVLVVDNIITRRPIEDDDIQLLEILAAQAALAIAHAHAMQELATKVNEIARAYSELHSSQKKFIEASKFAALGQMAATVAHEIRTPLVAIGGFVNQMLRKRTPDDPDYAHMKIVRDESLRLEDVLNRLLYYARPSLPIKEIHALQPLIDSVVALFESECKECNIVLELTGTGVPPFPFDWNQMRQVLMNLIQNSIQSMENGGTLSIGTYPEQDSIILEIRDTGGGIAPEHLDQIFEPFFSTKHAGTGLGMHVSQRIIHNHGGSIQVSSQLDEGTLVTIRLPRVQEEPDEKNTDH